MDYYKTYYYANICQKVIETPFIDWTEFLEGWMIEYLKPFQKWSVMHEFIDYCIIQIMKESNEQYCALDANELRGQKLTVNHALEYHKIKFDSFPVWLRNNWNNDHDSRDLICAYMDDLLPSDAFKTLMGQMTEEVFYVLFMNRKYLYDFNLFMANCFQNYEIHKDETEAVELLKKNGTLKRTYIPKWAKRAVFYRDRGMCSVCMKDLTGTVNISNKYNIDHIIPLAKYGLNDVSNLQLLCENCNASKNASLWNVSSKYEKWYN